MLNPHLSYSHSFQKCNLSYILSQSYNATVFYFDSISFLAHVLNKSKKISNDQELIQSDPTSCPQNQKGNN